MLLISLCYGSKVEVTQSCPTLCDPRDYTVHEILQVRILEWVAIPFSRESSQPRNRTQVSRIAGRQILYQLSHMMRDVWLTSEGDSAPCRETQVPSGVLMAKSDDFLAESLNSAKLHTLI